MTVTLAGITAAAPLQRVLPRKCWWISRARSKTTFPTTAPRRKKPSAAAVCETVPGPCTFGNPVNSGGNVLTGPYGRARGASLHRTQGLLIGFFPVQLIDRSQQNVRHESQRKLPLISGICLCQTDRFLADPCNKKGTHGVFVQHNATVLTVARKTVSVNVVATYAVWHAPPNVGPPPALLRAQRDMLSCCTLPSKHPGLVPGPLGHGSRL
ncbi:hypothetical protein BH23GEM6_BH23GEM6_20870 [soil metagenome]